MSTLFVSKIQFIKRCQFCTSSFCGGLPFVKTQAFFDFFYCNGFYEDCPLNIKLVRWHFRRIFDFVSARTLFARLFSALLCNVRHVLYRFPIHIHRFRHVAKFLLNVKTILCKLKINCSPIDARCSKLPIYNRTGE